MNTEINTPELLEILNCTPSTQNILLVGRHGIGKSEILTAHFEKKGMKVIPLFLGQMADPGDLIGLPYFDEETHHTEYYPPYWFPLDDKPIVLFLDELNRARPELMQSVMDLALNRKLAGKKLPEGSQVIAAVNAGDEYQVEELDPALVSRFNVYFFNPTAADWISWAEKNDLDERVIRFIRENQILLDGKEKSEEESENCFFKTPDRRAWKKVSDAVKNIPKLQEKHVKFIAGIIGKEAAVSFIVHTNHSQMEKFTASDFWKKGEKSYKAIMILSLSEFCDFADCVFKTIVPLLNVAEETKNHAQLFDSLAEWLCSENRNEELGYIVSLFLDGKYENANDFIKQNCEKACQIMRGFAERNCVA